MKGIYEWEEMKKNVYLFGVLFRNFFLINRDLILNNLEDYVIWELVLYRFMNFLIYNKSFFFL